MSGDIVEANKELTEAEKQKLKDLIMGKLQALDSCFHDLRMNHGNIEASEQISAIWSEVSQGADISISENAFIDLAKSLITENCNQEFANFWRDRRNKSRE